MILIVSIHSIIIALSGRIFQGLASDNMLHFALNAVYVQVSDVQRLGKLIGVSLALYMVGISISPAVASLLPNFIASFIMALTIFAVALLYLLLCVRTAKLGARSTNSAPVQTNSSKDTSLIKRLKAIFRTLSSPLTLFVARPILSFSGISLFLYTAAQSYLFPAIMVDTSLRFGFDGAQNGYVISVAHGASSLYLFFTLFMMPWLSSRFGSSGRTTSARHRIQYVKRENSYLASVSLATQGVALTLFGLANHSWQVYPIVIFISLGLATPSYIKTYLIALTPKSDGSRAVTASSTMEALGSLVSPVLLGVWQTLWPGTSVFFVGALIMMFCMILFLLGAAFDFKKNQEDGSSGTATTEA